MDIKICTGKTCSERFCSYIKTRLENDVEKFKLKNIHIEEVSCMGGCKKGPNIKINKEKFMSINPTKASELLFKKLKNANS